MHFRWVNLLQPKITHFTKSVITVILITVFTLLFRGFVLLMYAWMNTIEKTICLTFDTLKGMVNCQNSRDKGPPECNSARG